MNTQKQVGKLIARIAENLPEMEGEIRQRWIDAFCKLLSELPQSAKDEVRQAIKRRVSGGEPTSFEKTVLRTI